MDWAAVTCKAYFDALENVASNTIAFQQLNLFDNSRNPILAYNAGILGQVIALEGRVLPEGAVVYIQLADVSLADAEAEIITTIPLGSLMEVTGASEDGEYIARLLESSGFEAVRGSSNRRGKPIRSGCDGRDCSIKLVEVTENGFPNNRLLSYL